MPRISEETIRRVAEATDIVELVGSYFPLKRTGSTFRALCPFHNEKTPSFHVTPARQTYHCFGCGAGGTVFRFLMEYEHVDFAESVRRLASRAGIAVVEDAGGLDDAQQSRRRRLMSLHAEAAAWFHAALFSPAGTPARDYIKARGLGAPEARTWQLGYAGPSWDELIVHLRGAGFSEPEIELGGLGIRREGATNLYARFRHRLMFPIRNDYGEVIAFSGRLLEADAKSAKYVNSPETPVFSKGRVLFGLDKSKRALIEAKTAVVCEGQIDTISVFEAGVRNVIAPQGTAFTPEQARLLSRFVETVVLCFDSDRAGQEATARSLPSLLECGLSVKVARLPEGHDPDSLIRAEGAGAFQAVLEASKDFFDYAIEKTIESGALADPSRTAAASRKLGTYLALVKDPVLRDAVSGRVCARLGIAPKSLEAQIKQAKTPRPVQAAATRVEAETEDPIRISEGVAILCRLAIQSPEAREWLATQKEPAPTALGDGGELLGSILTYQGTFDSPSAISAYVTTLPPAMERAFAALDVSRPVGDPLERCRLAWSGLAAAILQEEQETVKARLRQPGLTREQMTDFHKQILDLRARLNELLPPAASA